MLKFEIPHVQVINGDNLYICKNYLDNFTCSDIMFDPPFSSLIEGYGTEDNFYEHFLISRLQVALSLLQDKGRLISVNYSDGARIVEDYLINKKYKKFFRTSLKRHDRGQIMSNPYIYIDIYSKENLDFKEDSWEECCHRAGYRSNKIRHYEAMQQWEVERIFSTIGVNKITNVLDMFGGCGTVPIVCNGYKIKCTSIENNINNFNIIIKRLSIPTKINQENICILRACNETAVSKGFCSKHYNRKNKFERNNRKVFIGLDNNFEEVWSTTEKSKQQLTELAKATADKARKNNGYKNNSGSKLGRYLYEQNNASSKEATTTN